MELEIMEPPVAADPAAEIARPPRSLEHRELRRDDFWTAVPAFGKVSAGEFHTHTFQARHTVTNVRQLRETLQHLVPDSFYEDVIEGLKRAPMALRISPYLLSL